ncbi:MAG TPA: hypothetical protein VJT15_02200 [Pyrinomonadaceae bacterium]|nr:hypothetical protein [Pyrinomonadaceae bacterium]
MKKPPAAPAVYRPQATPKVLQTKLARTAQPVVPVRPPQRSAPAPVYTPKVLQAKKVVPLPVPRKPEPRPQPVPKVVQPKRIAPKPAFSPKAIQRKTIQRKAIAHRPAGVIQPKYATGTYVTVLSDTGPWYGVVSSLLPTGYRVRMGGTTDHLVDVDDDSIAPHPSFARRLEEWRNGDTVTTAGGTWTAVEYNSKMGAQDPTARGLHIKLEFTPNHTVDATRIVLVQTVTAIKNDQIYYKDQSVANRARFHVSIDQTGDSASPEYAAAGGPTSGGAFGRAPVQNAAGQHGYRYKPWFQAWRVQSAWLTDNPHMRGITGFSQQRFETTAIAAEGTDRGRYYGSVRWGWVWRPGTAVKLIPLEVINPGYGASQQFRESAKQWNITQTTTGRAPTQIPLQ